MEVEADDIVQFLGISVPQLMKQLTKLCASAFPHLSLRVIFQSGRLLSDFLSFKDRIFKSPRSRVVYKFRC